MESFLSADNRGIRSEREVDSRERYQVGLELVQVDVKRAIESEGGGNGRDDLSDQSVEVGVTRGLNAEVLSANVVNGFIVDHERTIRVLQSSVGCQDRVVGLHNGGRHLGCRVDRELKLALLSIISAKSFQQQTSETGTGTTSE